MPKNTTIHHTSVLQAALLGYEMQRNRIEAAIAEIQDELGQGGTSRSISTATATPEQDIPRKKRFSAAARKRMAAAQKKRWKEMKAKKAEATKPKGKKASAPASRKQRPIQVKAVKKTAPKPKAMVKKAPQPQVKNAAVETPKIVTETPAPKVATTEPVPEAATA